MDRELSDPALVKITADDAIKQLDKLSRETHTQIPMSEYVKILLWEKNTLWEIEHPKLMRQIEQDKRDGWTIEEHTWCGQPWHEFSIPSLGIYKEC